jgi:cold-inducible RNA-binding protein
MVSYFYRNFSDMKLFVAGLVGDFDDVDLKELFELYGEVKSAQIIIDRQTRKSKGFGFVEMSSTEEAKEVMGLLNGKKMFGKILVVKPAEEPGTSSGGGGFNSRNNNRDNRDRSRPRFR